MLSGHPGGLWMNVPTLADPTLAPPGEHVVTMTALVPYDIGSPWEGERERFADELLTAFEPLVPGLRDELDIIATATPLTLERYAGNSQGATFGWANIPSQSASRRLSRVTPIKELFLAGHWTHPGTGSLRCLVSGLHTAMMMLEMQGQELPAIEPDTDLPPWG
jgi:prolycopene isomerase